MEKINIGVVINDFNVELREEGLTICPLTIGHTDSYVFLRDFKNGLLSICFISFLNRFCSERNLDWFVSFDTKSVIIG